MKQFIFSFDDKKIRKLKNKKNILGGKGSNLAEMGRTRIACASRFYNYHRSL